MAVLPDQPPLRLPVAQWAPDMPDFQPDASVYVNGVIPRTPVSYGPMSSQVVFSGAINKVCQGAAAFLDTSGNVSVFAGDAADLYELTPASTTPSVVSKSSGAYTLTNDGQWNFAQFGSRVIATDYEDAIQTFTLGSSTKFADLASAAPKARYAAVIKSFLVVANTYDSTNGAQPQRVWCAANNDPTSWPTPGTSSAAEVQSDYWDIVGKGGWNQGIVGNLGTADGALFQEHAIWRIIYNGTSSPFSFYPAEGGRGCPAPNSIVQLGDQVYALLEDGFYRFDGTYSYPIGANRVDKSFWADVNQSYLYNIKGTVDPINKLIIWAYPSGSSSNGLPDKLLLYNWQIDRWAQGAATIETLVQLLSFGYTLDQTYTVLGYTLDTLPFPLDSRVWTGGKLLLGAFDQNHKLNYFSGSAQAATVDTPEIQPFPGRHTDITDTRPLVDGGTPSVAIGTRLRTVDTVAFGTASSMGSDGNCPVLAEGRYVRARITLPAGASWTHIEGIDLEAKQGPPV